MAEPAQAGQGMVRGLRRPGRGAEAARVAALARERFALPDDVVVVASELHCQVPGCPPIETVVLIWDEGGERYRLRIFRPSADVSQEDLPPRWYLPALRDEGEGDCGCC